MKKKLFSIFLILIFASSASATVYRWVDERGVTSFADDYDKVPPPYRSNVEEVNMPKRTSNPSQTPSGKVTADARSGEKTKQLPPISQTLVREGDLAIKLAESLKIGKPTSEAEAESILASAGIAPRNGWIADYPVTPEIFEELTKAVGEAADARKLVMGKEEALRAVRTAAAELELPVIAEVPDGYAEGPPPEALEYPDPSAVENYYFAEGPPVITYFLPPPDYFYLYAWVPFPFWCSGFYYPGYYMLHDFHRVHHHHGPHDRHHHGPGDRHIVTNHVRDHRTGRMATIDPTKRHQGTTLGLKETPRTKGFGSKEARNAAQSIFERSRERSNIPSSRMIDNRGRDNRTPTYSRPRSGNEGKFDRSNPPAPNYRNGNNGRPSVNDRRTTPGGTGAHIYGRNFSRPESMNRQNGITVPRPSPGLPRSYPPPSSLQGNARSFSMAPNTGGSQHFNSSRGGGGFSGSQGGGGGLSGFHPGGGGGGAGRGGSPRY